MSAPPSPPTDDDARKRRQIAIGQNRATGVNGSAGLVLEVQEEEVEIHCHPTMDIQSTNAPIRQFAWLDFTRDALTKLHFVIVPLRLIVGSWHLAALRMVGYTNGSFTNFSREQVCLILPFQGRALGLDLGICPMHTEKEKEKKPLGDFAARALDADDLDSIMKLNNRIQTLEMIFSQWRSSNRDLHIDTGSLFYSSQTLSLLSSTSSPSPSPRGIQADILLAGQKEMYIGILNQLKDPLNLQTSELSNFHAAPALVVLILSKTRYSLREMDKRVRCPPSSASNRQRQAYLIRQDCLDQLASIHKDLTLIVNLWVKATSAFCSEKIINHKTNIQDIEKVEV
ncbi:hypothetical protein DL95DRAFT_415192 [Leptodontidium sp. 2 PMI_412]|nr:hypothetical protein DL95DRAFT_415192 [Leptodontidium sp. 2 PMI_412]